MEIKYSNLDQGTAISVSDDSNDSEIVITAYADNSEAWHSFNNVKRLDEFIDTMTFMRNRLAEKQGINNIKP